MPNINQNPMNTHQKSKASLVLFIVSILILVGVGGYLVYAQSLNKTAETNNVAQDDLTSNMAEDNTATSGDESSSTSSQIPADWKEYTLTGCEIKMFIPNDWQPNDSNLSVKSIAFNSPKTLQIKNNINKSIPDIYPSDILIKCYDSLDEFTANDWGLVRKRFPDFDQPKDLWDALTRVNPIFEKEKYSIMYASNVEKKKYGEKDTIQAMIGGGIGEASFTLYFQKNEKIISFSGGESTISEYFQKEPQKTIIDNFQWFE